MDNNFGRGFCVCVYMVVLCGYFSHKASTSDGYPENIIAFDKLMGKNIH